MWGRAGNNARRLMYFAIQRHAARTKAMPHLVFLIDADAEAAGPQVLDLPGDLPIGTKAVMTEPWHANGSKIRKEQVQFTQTAPGTIQVGFINLKPDRARPGPRPA